ncbi:DUF6233 domain-containing protein [Streptomyces sp. 900105245]
MVEKRLHAGHPLGATVHRADCTMIQGDANATSADDARQALTGDRRFFRACGSAGRTTFWGCSARQAAPAGWRDAVIRC